MKGELELQAISLSAKNMRGDQPILSSQGVVGATIVTGQATVASPEVVIRAENSQEGARTSRKARLPKLLKKAK